MTSPSIYLDIEDAAELTGFSVKYLRKLARSGQIDAHRDRIKELVSWSDVKTLASTHKPAWVALPDSLLDAQSPSSEVLLYESRDDQKQSSVEVFRDVVRQGSCIDILRQMPPKSVQSVVTSPPYWGVRKYPGETVVRWADGSSVALGEESTVEAYVGHLLEVLRHLKRVLRDDGTLWWNMGDTYQTRAYLRSSSTERLRAFEGDRSDTWSTYPNKRYSSGHPYLKDKDLTLSPFLLALGAQRLGYYLRAVIVWYKDNTLPEPVNDRPTTSHEYIFLFAKARFYKYDKGRETEAAVTGEAIKRVSGKQNTKLVGSRQLRTVWQFPTSSKHGDHTAAFPIELPLRCLRLSTSPGDLVLDPFCGSGTTLALSYLVAIIWALTFCKAQ